MSQSRATEIDFLRAYAVLAVIATHSSRVVTVGITGYHGVLLFFVISGFLITGILLDARATNGPTRGILTAFYARRFLRIFPIYYAVLFVAFVLGFQNVRAEIGWLLTYLSNWYFASRGFTGNTSHLWSLAVEEQFYLFWPWPVLLVPSAALPWVIGITILVGPASRLLIGSGATNDVAAWIATPTVLDALGLGGLLAYLWRKTERADQVARWALVAGLLLIGLEKAQHWLAIPPNAKLVLDTLGWRLLCVWLVHRAARGIGGRLGQLIRARPFVYIGTISYTIYLIHPFLNVPISRVEQRFNISWLSFDHPGRFIVMTLISVAIAALSWEFFEKPINSLKERFPYVPHTSAARSKSRWRKCT